MAPTHLIPSALLERAGWTVPFVSGLLGEPGQRKKGPGRTQLWARAAGTRIEPAAATSDFVPARARIAQRRIAQRKKVLASMRSDPVNAA
jgi:hypothetical protein